MPIKEIKLPHIGEGVTEGEMVDWLVKVGDHVKVDQPIAEMMTDKATVEIPSPLSGKVKEFKVQKGDMVPIQSTLLLLEITQGSSESLPPSLETAETESVEKEVKSPSLTPSPSPESSSSSPEPYLEKVEKSKDFSFSHIRQNSVLASPATRKLAREFGIDLSQVKGTGLAGRIRRDDVLNQANLSSKSTPSSLWKNETEEKISPPFPSTTNKTEWQERVPLRGIRRKIALQMKKSKSLIPHFTIVEEAFVSKLFELRKNIQNKNQTQNIKITYLPFIIKALTQTLRDFPIFNASLEEEKEEIVYKKDHNIGIAVSTENGLMVPNIKKADQKTLLELASEIRNLSKNARSGKLSLPQLQNGSFTITNIGSVGGIYASPIINHPEVAILGMYKIQDKPILKSTSEIEVKKKLSLHLEKVMNFSITCDHRLIDGAVAAEFLKSFVYRIENPYVLLLEMS